MLGIPLYFDSTFKESPRGLVAEYCPICWKPQKFKCWDVYEIKRFNVLIALSNKHMGFVVRCSECNFSRHVNSERYIHVAHEDLPLDQLIQATFPDFMEYFAEQIELGKKLQHSGVLSDEERQLAIDTVFNHVALEVERIGCKEVDIDRRSVLTCFTTLVLAGGSVAILSLLAVNNRALLNANNLLALAILAPASIITLGTVYTIVSLGRQPRRNARSIALPMCGRGLKHVRPSEEEIKIRLQEMRLQRLKISRFLTASMILDAVQECS